MNNKIFTLLIGIFGILGMLLILWITPFGSGVSADSTVYLESAQNIIEGQGFVQGGVPITHYPPMYSIALSMMGFFSNDLIQVARYFNSFLFGVNIVLVASIVTLATDKKALTFVMAAIFTVATAPLIEIHSMAWTEPLFITFTLISVYLLYKCYKNPTNWVLFSSAITLSLVVVTRYVGIALILAGLVIVVISLQDRSTREKFLIIIGWLVLALTPLLIFLLRNLFVTSNATNRSIVFHPISITEFVRKVLTNIFNLFAPSSFPFLVRPLIFVILSALIFYFVIQVIRRSNRGYDNGWEKIGLVIVSFIFTTFYIGLLYLSISFIDGSTPVDKRILFPILIVFILGVFQLLWFLSEALNKKIIWWAFLGLTLLSISLKMPDAVHMASRIKNEGLGYTSKRWINSESIDYMSSLDTNTKIYSNGTDVLGFSVSIKSFSLPKKYSSITNLENPDYKNEIVALCSEIKEKKAIVLYFDKIYRNYLPTKDEIENNCNIVPTEKFSDGALYGELSK